MADLLEMSQRNYSKIENGEVSITLNRLLEISKILNVPVEELLGYSVKSAKLDVNGEERLLYREMMNRMEAEIKYLKELMRTITK